MFGQPKTHFTPEEKLNSMGVELIGFEGLKIQNYKAVSVCTTSDIDLANACILEANKRGYKSYYDASQKGITSRNASNTDFRAPRLLDPKARNETRGLYTIKVEFPKDRFAIEKFQSLQEHDAEIFKAVAAKIATPVTFKM